MTFVGTPQCGYGTEQAWTPIYLGGRLEGSKSHSHECVSLEQPPQVEIGQNITTLFATTCDY